MSKEIYRPLIKLSKQAEIVYLPLKYIYSLSDIANIKKYLSKTLSFVGVDAR